jgi:threonine dehydratase
MKDSYLKKILNARVYDVAFQSPLQTADRLSKRLGNTLWLKREDQQQIFCYKLRGAYNKMSSLDNGQLKNGVVAASAGNHAQGVALAAQKLGCRAVIFMPITTPEIKKESVENLGGIVKLVGDSYSDAGEAAREYCRSNKMTYIPPFDDPEVIAGQGTVAAEIIRQTQHALDAIFIPIGGGGLISGMATYIKAVRPEIKIIGVEPDDSNAMAQSIAAGERVVLDDVGIFADGVAVKQVGEETFRLCQLYVDEIVEVSTDEICAAIKDIYEDTRSIMEPAGALGVAGIKKWLKQQQDKGEPQENRHYATVLTGANMNFDRLRHVSERAEIGEGRESIITVVIPEKPGSFQRLLQIIGDLSVTEFNYRYSGPDLASIFIGFQAADHKRLEACFADLKQHNFHPVDLSDNELTKVHGRHLVGGRAPELDDERILSFQFPERPGALLNFLEQISGRWNISLFHYRNHGSDFGRVLCGLQVPEETNTEFNQFLKDLGYHYSDQTKNPFNALFLS